MVNEISNKLLESSQAQPQAQSLSRNNVLELKAAGDNKLNAVLAEENKLEPEEKTQKVEQTTSRLNEIAQQIHRDITFSVDDNSGDVVITVTDSQTNKVIRQIPEEHVLAVRENIESLKGILFSAKI